MMIKFVKVEENKYSTREGLYIVERHAELIKKEEKDLIIKSRKFKVKDKKFYLITNDNRLLGEIELGAPESIDIDEFKELSEKHRVTKKERETWWSGKDTLYKYGIKDFEEFSPELSYNYKPGVQTFQKGVTPLAKESHQVQELDLQSFKSDGMNKDLNNPKSRWRELLSDLRYLGNSAYPALKAGDDWGKWTLEWVYKYYAAVVDSLRSVWFTIIPPEKGDEKYSSSYWETYRKSRKHMDSEPPNKDEVEEWDEKRENTIITESNREVEFELLYRSWKGQEVIRGTRKGEDWIIMLALDGYTEFHCPKSPLEEDSIVGELKKVDDEFWDFEGDIPADHPVNPLESIPVKQVILDQGKATLLAKDDRFKKITFKGNRLQGTWAFKKSNNLWTIERSEGPGSELT